MRDILNSPLLFLYFVLSGTRMHLHTKYMYTVDSGSLDTITALYYNLVAKYNKVSPHYTTKLLNELLQSN